MGLTRDAEAVGARLPIRPWPHICTRYQRGERRAVTVRLCGREYRAFLVETWEYEERTACRLGRPGASEGDPGVRVWWDDGALRWGWLPDHGRDAEQARPWPVTGPQPVRRDFGPEHPMLWVHLGGAWCAADLLTREDWPTGRVVYTVHVRLPGMRPWESPVHRRVFYDSRSVQRRTLCGREDGRR